jgi:hypothetical protein
MNSAEGTSSLIVFDSAELACIHEAGHAEVALRLGAMLLRWSSIEISRGPMVGRGLSGRTPSAGTSLWAVSRPSEKEFIDYAISNALNDRIAFFGGDVSEILCSEAVCFRSSD